MVELHQTYAALFWLSAAVAFVLASAAWNHRSLTGAWPLAVLMLGVSIWASASAMQWSVDGGPQHIAWLKVMFFGIWMTPVGFLALALDLAWEQRWRTPARIALLAVPPSLLASLAWLNPGGLFHRGFTTVSVGTHVHYTSQPGPFYWGFGVLTLLMLATGFAVIIRTHQRSTGPQRVQTTIVLIGSVIPFGASVISEVRLLPLTGLDLTPIGFLATGAFWLTALSLGQFLDVLPVARHTLVEQMTDGVVVLDREGRVADMNPAAVRMLGAGLDAGEGLTADTAFEGMPEVLAALRRVDPNPSGSSVVALPQYCTDDCSYFNVKVTAIETAGSSRAAHLVILQDITAERRSKALLEKTNAELEESHRQVEALNEELKEQALHDPLTGLHNRRYLADALPREIARARRENGPVGFLVLDIDEFKSVNDDYSHQAGDAALVVVSEALREGARASDIICRQGGDEFLVVMPGAGTEDAFARAEELRARVAKATVVWEGGECSVTISVGASSIPACGNTAEDGFAAADRALYRAKEAGRNGAAAASESGGTWE